MLPLLLASSQIFFTPGQPMAPSELSQDFYIISSKPAKPAYLIPEDASAVGHWNATDLANGTAKIGSPWTTVGTVAFETGVAVRPGVGPFPSGNYYKQTSGAFSFLAAPFTEVAIWYGAPTGTEQVILGTQNQELNVGTTNTSGFYYGSNLYPANAPVSSPSINVTFGGIDGSGNCWAQLNGGTAVSTSCSYVGISAQDALGVYAGDLATFPATGLKLVEAYATTAVPSAGAFTAIYNAIVANE